MNGHPSNATHETTTADPEIVDMIDGVAPQQHVQNNDDNDSDLDFDADDEPIIIEHTSTCKLALTIIGAAAGNFLEWFDFAVFGLLAEELADNFFPSNNGTTRLLELFSVYAGSFLMRPLGGMLFGYLGDRFGRLFALRLSIFLMAFPTFLTGCLPTYNQIGIAATILLVLLRLLQGLSVGGELTGALVYVLEICPQNRRVLFGLLVQISGAGTFLASIVDGILRASLNDSEMRKFGWRIPFWFGLIVALFGIFMRRALKDSETWKKLKEMGKVEENPIKSIFKKHKLAITVVIMHIILAGSGYYTLFIWFSTYLSNDSLRKSDKYIINNPYIINVVAMLICGITAIIGANIADKYNKSVQVMISGGIFYIISTLILYPVIENLDKTQYGGIVVCLCLLSGTFGWYYGPISTWAVDALPNAETRYSGMGIAYNVSLALFGGTTPLMGTAVTAQSGLFGYACLVTFFGILSIGAVIFVEYRRKKGKWSSDQDVDNNHRDSGGKNNVNTGKSNARFASIGKKSSKKNQHSSIPTGDVR